MNVHEWPLTLFTIMAQMAVGGFIGLGVIQVFGRTRFGQETVDRMNPPALYALGPIMVIALAGSMFHLGNPFNAPNAIRHLQTSWLAREILFGAGFAGLGFLFAIVTWFKLFDAKIRTVIAIFTAVWGLAFIWVMANVYMLETVPAWNTWTTPAQFYLTAFLLGALVLGVAYTSYPRLQSMPRLSKIMNGKNPPATDSVSVPKINALTNTTVRTIGVVAMTLLVAELIVVVFARMQPAGMNPPEVPFSTTLFIIRMALLVIGAGGLGFFLAMQPSEDIPAAGGEEKALATNRRLRLLITVAFVLVFLSEIIGRFMFYGEMNRIGI